MDLSMTPAFREVFVSFLESCGGINGPMHGIAMRIKESDSKKLDEILGAYLDVPGPINGVIETCGKTNGKLDVEGLVRHFSSAKHMQEMSNLKASVASELPKEVIPFAHTLLPLSVLKGRYYYDCGDTLVELDGLIQVGPTNGSPYAHLAALIWLPDNGLGVSILAEQGANGVAASGKKFDKISYHEAPRLRKATIDGAKELYDKA